MQKVIAAFILLASIVSQAKDKQPEQVTIAASAQAVKNAAVKQLSHDGWTINSEGQFQVVFIRPRSAGMQFMAALGAIGQSSAIRGQCAPEARVFLTMNFAEADGQTFVTSSEALSDNSVGPPSCFRLVEDHTNGARKKQDAILAAIKTAAESSQTAAPTPLAAVPVAAPVAPATAPPPAEAAKVETVSAVQPQPTTAAAPVMPATAPLPAEGAKFETVSAVQPQPAGGESLGDAAKRMKQRKACLELAKDNPSIICK